MKQLTEASIIWSTLNPQAKLNYIGDDEVTLRTDEDSVEMLSDVDVSACIDGWWEERHVEAAEHRVGVLSQVLLDIDSLATRNTIEDIRCFVG